MGGWAGGGWAKVVVKRGEESGARSKDERRGDNKGENGAFPGVKNIVFVHTGGLFGVFPQQQNFSFD